MTLGEPALDTADFAGAGQEAEDVTRRLGERGVDQTGHGLVVRCLGTAGPVADIDRKQRAARADDRRFIEQRGDARGIERRRHHQQAQLGIEVLAGIQRQRQREVGVEAAFVELVEDHQAHARQLRIGRQSPRQQALGEDLDARLRPDAALEADLVADRPADLLAQQRRHARGGSAGGDTARLQQHDLSVRQPGLVEQGERDGGGLARARRRGEHGASRPAQGLAQGRQGFEGGIGGQLHGARIVARRPATMRG